MFSVVPFSSYHLGYRGAKPSAAWSRGNTLSHEQQHGRIESESGSTALSKKHGRLWRRQRQAGRRTAVVAAVAAARRTAVAATAGRQQPTATARQQQLPRSEEAAVAPKTSAAEKQAAAAVGHLQPEQQQRRQSVTVNRGSGSGAVGHAQPAKRGQCVHFGESGRETIPVLTAISTEERIGEFVEYSHNRLSSEGFTGGDSIRP